MIIIYLRKEKLISKKKTKKKKIKNKTKPYLSIK